MHIQPESVKFDNKYTGGRRMQPSLTRIHKKLKKNEKTFRAITEEISASKSVVMLLLGFLTAGVSFTGSSAPFAVALFGVALKYGIIPFVVLCITILGLTLAGAQQALSVYILTGLLYAGIHVLIKNKKNGLKAVAIALAYFSSSVTVAALLDRTFYDFLYGFLYAALTGLLYVIYDRAVSGIDDLSKGLKLNGEQYAALYIAVFLALSAMTNYRIANVNIGVIIYLFVVMICSYYGNIGISGIFVLSALFVGHLSGFSDMFVYFLLCVTVLISALTKESSKVLYCAAAVFGWLVTALVFYDPMIGELYVVETLLGIILFASFPAQAGNYIFDMISPKQRQGTTVVYNAKGALLTRKITSISGMLQKVSSMLPDEEFKNTEIKNDAYRLIDIAAGKICEECTKCAYCWEENFYSTYQAIFAAVATINTGGTFHENDLPGKFKRTCLKLDDFVTSINNCCEVFKMDKIYRRHIDNIKNIARDQITHIAAYIHDYYDYVDRTKSACKEIENEIYRMLSSIGCIPSDIYISVLCEDKYMVELLYDKSSEWRENLDLILSVVSRVLGEKIEYETGYFGDHYDIKITCKPVKQYGVSTWIAKKAASENSVSGDSYTFFENSKGLYVAAVSDGMGTGKKAHKRSNMVMNLLECFYEDYHNHDSVIKIINSFLAMKTEQESFSTVDMCTMNLFSGEAEFVKAGGCSTFVYDGKEVKMYGSNTTPVGILDRPNTYSVKETANNSLVIVLLTDGVLDVLGENDIRYIIASGNDSNIQNLADTILKSALEKCNQKPRDDMLVLVNKMWKLHKV
jgi:stage II sporulation protein E